MGAVEQLYIVETDIDYMQNALNTAIYNINLFDDILKGELVRINLSPTIAPMELKPTAPPQTVKLLIDVNVRGVCGLEREEEE